MNLFHVRYFIELAHTRHYTKSAEHLGITQPSLSHAIAQLEEELGVPLFEKSGRNTVLTCYGEQFLDCTENVIKALDNGVESLRRGACGEGVIRLGLLRPLGVEFIPDLVANFLSNNPNKDIQFTFHTGATQYLLDGLMARQYNLVFCSKPPIELGLTAVPIEHQDLLLIVPKNHPLSRCHTVELKDTLPYPYVYFAKGSGLRNDVDELFAKIEGKPQIAYEIEEDQVVAGLVARNFGIAVIPYMDLLLKLDVNILKIVNSTVERKIYMVSDDRIYIPPVVQSFCQFVLHGKRS